MTIYARLVPDRDAEKPIWNNNIGLLICGNRYMPGDISLGDLEDFCNSRFDDHYLNYRLDNDDSVQVRDYVESCGALTSCVDDGFFIMGHRQIVSMLGYDNPRSRAEAQKVLDSVATEYKAWADGDVWGIVLMDDGEEDDPRYFTVTDDGPNFEDEELDSVYGFYGYDYAYDAAVDMIRKERIRRGATISRSVSTSGRTRTRGKPAVKKPASKSTRAAKPKAKTPAKAKTKGVRR